MIPSPALARLALRFPLKGPLLGRPLVRDGQTLDRTIQWLLWLESHLSVPPLSAHTVEEARRNSRLTTVIFSPTDPTVQAVDIRLPGPDQPIPARRYRPQGLGSTNLPTLVFFHGGGWVLGDLETHDGVCRAFATRAACQVIAVDYRLAPEYPYPAPVDDAWAALQALVADPTTHGIDPTRIAVGGDSAGGNLSAAVALRARDAQLGAPCFQLLIYPGTDNSRESASYETFAEGFLLSRADIRWFRGHYLPDEASRCERDASPLLAVDVGQVAPACLLTAGYDPLRDEGQAYADRLAAAGVPTRYDCFPGLVHGFLNLAGAVPAAARATVRGSVARTTARSLSA